MTTTEKVKVFFEENDLFNFYIYDQRGEKVGKAVNNDTIEQALSKFENCISRLEPGKYHLKAKQSKGDTSNSGLIRHDFVIEPKHAYNPKNPNHNAMSEEMLKIIREDAYNRAKFELQFEQMQKDVERLKKYEPLLNKLAENQKAFIRAVEQLTDDDDDNDESGIKRLSEAKDTVAGLMDMFENLKK